MLDALHAIYGVMARPTRTFERIRDSGRHYLPYAAFVTATILILNAASGLKVLFTSPGQPMPDALALFTIMSFGALAQTVFLVCAYYAGRRMGGNQDWRKVFAVLMYANAIVLVPAALGMIDTYVGVPEYALIAQVIHIPFGIWYIAVLVVAARAVNTFSMWRSIKLVILASLPVVAMVLAISAFTLMMLLGQIIL